MESIFSCPNCGGKLILTDKTYRCQSGHTFDKAKEGYVYLLPVNQKNSKMPGDDKEMAQARNAFLSHGYYAPLRDELCRLVKEAAPVTLLDIGCGEGYYTAAIAEAVPKARLCGIDISKPSIRLAAKKVKTGEIAVASAFRLPLPDASIDLAVNCFSPLATEEICRVVKKGGTFLYVVPGEDHLYEMKEILYDKPYKNKEQDIPYEGLVPIGVTTVRTTVNMPKEHLWQLFAMTPYYWKTPKEGVQRLKATDALTITLSFHIHRFTREDTGL